MARYRKKPVVIEAVQWDGKDETILKIFQLRVVPPIAQAPITLGQGGCLNINTPEGAMTVLEGDWIICGVKGVLYPCKPDIFGATYEKA